MNQIFFLEKVLLLNDKDSLRKYNILMNKISKGGGQVSSNKKNAMKYLDTKNFKLDYYVVPPSLKIVDIRPNRNIVNENKNPITPHFSKTKNNINTLLSKSDNYGQVLIHAFYLHHPRNFMNIMKMYANSITYDLLKKKSIIYDKNNLDVSTLHNIISNLNKRTSILYWIAEDKYVHITLIIIDILKTEVVLTLFDPNGTYSFFYNHINKLVKKYNDEYSKKIKLMRGSKKYQNESPPQMNLPLCQLYTMRMLLVELLNPNIHTLLLTNYLIKQTMASYEKFIIQSAYFLLYLLQLIRKHNSEIKSTDAYQISYKSVAKVLHELNPDIKIKSLVY